MSRAKVSLQDIAGRLGVSVKTVSGALHGDGSIRMSSDTRQRIRALAEELGYVPNLVARGMRRGVMPIIGIVADGLITQPFATEIMRAFDNSMRADGLSVIVTSTGSGRPVEASIAELQRLMPQAIAYATMYHQVVELPPAARDAVRLMINCRDTEDTIPSLVPAEREAAATITRHLIASGRRRIAFINLPGLLAGELRGAGFRDAHAAAGLAVDESLVRPATRGTYSGQARSLVFEHVAELFGRADRPDAILCGNDRVALEVYGALRRHDLAIPDDVAVASFDNQVEIAARLDPPLTTMALPHRAMGRRAAEILAGHEAPAEAVEEIPFRFVERASV
ncbi:LacI family DNA-binding transcriptional regulator [Kaistia geumhonensis]|uniref:DNA-binding LacI/PurR family transcriptional regulator n=1 Tax=Kaistia geumhonensis TaxID=410839 RepID=A0ABU0M562_9HYPH|nr:LacI family DNA-binding transcriptional regulator [Kaistia geumhonensis]MCX5478682.1 LacI family DNA-binding transcriptional regulator [Kaistia geumhonensis]MDQ0516100.1 DNA-binding LacI/PurR family transcriptional regulator [Kaistia geumhonensis]